MTPTNPNRYQHFTVAVYCPVYAVQKMADLDWLTHSFEVMSRSIKIGKIYLETHRDMVVADEATITAAKRFFEETRHRRPPAASPPPSTSATASRPTATPTPNTARS